MVVSDIESYLSHAIETENTKHNFHIWYAEKKKER